MRGTVEISGWRIDNPAPRVHHIDEVAQNGYWKIRGDKVKEYFDDLKADENAMYTMPVSGDLVMARHQGETWIYRISRDPEPVNSRKYDEEGVDDEVDAVDPHRFKFTLVRGGESHKFIARLINHREGFWGKVTEAPSEGGSAIYTVREVEKQDGNSWKNVPNGVNQASMEKDDRDDVKVGTIVWVTKTMNQEGWEYVFMDASGGGLPSDYYPLQIEICTDSGPKTFEFLVREVI
jgi:hypothetical protein